MIYSAISGFILPLCIGLGAGALVVFTVVFNIVRRIKGKSSCGCSSENSGCNGDCSRCSACKRLKDDEGK